MAEPCLELRDRVRRKAMSLGEEGLTWLATLEDQVAVLAREWDLTIGPTYEGGTESLVIEATTADGRDAVLKIGLPGVDPTAREARTLRAADGRGYSRLFRHDADRRAMLLERLGPQLISLDLTLDAQIAVICATLREGWTRPPDGERFMTGAEKAVDLAGLIATAWDDLGRPCSAGAVETALAFAELRRRAFDPDQAVLAHGDAHAWNTLLVPGPGPRRFKFVDPDGLFIEPAHDLAISLREWSAELLAGDPVALGRRRCRLLADLTGVDPEPIWQWGLVERVANGLLLKQIGLDETAGEFFRVAEAWAMAR